MKKYILLILSLITVVCSFGQKADSSIYQLYITLEGAPFDSLFLYDYTDGHDLLFSGYKTDISTWTFDIPDTIIDNTEYIKLLVTQHDTVNNSSTEVRFVNQTEVREIFVSNIGVENQTNYIHAIYRGNTLYKEEGNFTKQDANGNIIISDLICEDFELIIEDEGSDITIRAKDPYFCWFMAYGGEEKSYNDYLQSYIELSKKHPDSRYLITYLSNNLTNFKSKEDVKIVYENLSNKHRKSKWAKKIENFLAGSFQNIDLQNLVLNIHEKVVQDDRKFNLIIFAASYCIPCIEEIPLLKEIYKDLGEDLTLTYISLDQEKNIDLFEKLLKEYAIPWRTLYAYDRLSEVIDIYHINGIPHNLLVYPDGRMEILDVRRGSDLKKIYFELGSDDYI